eukprot:2866262-Ditylum_brightwellii.AAC.1
MVTALCVAAVPVTSHPAALEALKMGWAYKTPRAARPRWALSQRPQCLKTRVGPIEPRDTACRCRTGRQPFLPRQLR